MALSGHTLRHTSQPSQKEVFTTALPSAIVIASNRQARTQALHPVQREGSTFAVCMPQKGFSPKGSGFRSISRSGASTSASHMTVLPKEATSKEVSVVFPVPPLPLMTTIS
jgi:hypothetical protein